MTTIAAQLGARIKTARAKAGLSQAALGRAAFINQPSICHLERGDSEASISQLVAIARALDVTPAFLLDIPALAEANREAR